MCIQAPYPVDVKKKGKQIIKPYNLEHGKRDIWVFKKPEDWEPEPEIPPEIEDKVLNEIEIDKYITEMLDTIIVRDKKLKISTFYVYFSTYLDGREEEIINEFLKGPPSIGKTHVAVNVAKLFPPEDVLILHDPSPTSLLHKPEDAQEDAEYVGDFSNKIYVFVERVSRKFKEMMKPILSQDKYITKPTP